MANNTGLIIGVSVLGVAAVGVTIYLLSKKSSKTTDIKIDSTNRGEFLPVPNRVPNPQSGFYANPAPAGRDSWWQQPLGQVGGNLANKLIDNIFKPKDSVPMNTASNSNSGFDDSAFYDAGDTDPNFYGGYGEV